MANKAFEKINISKHICNSLVGREHTQRHRVGTGMIIMAVGVTIAKVGACIHFWWVEYALDITGYLIHGIGCLPIIEHMEEKYK